MAGNFRFLHTDVTLYQNKICNKCLIPRTNSSAVCKTRCCLIFSAAQAPDLAVLEGGSTVPAIMVEFTMAVLWDRGADPEPRSLCNFRRHMKKSKNNKTKQTNKQTKIPKKTHNSNNRIPENSTKPMLDQRSQTHWTCMCRKYQTE